MPHTTLIIDEIPGRIVGDDDQPPGRILHLDAAGQPIWQTDALKMPYDAAPDGDGGYYVCIIRAKAVWRVARDGAVTQQLPVGGYPCSLQLLPGGNLLVAGWDYHLPGFVRELSPDGAVVWQLEGLRWPWKAERLADGGTLVADAGTGRVFEVSPAGQEVWAAEGLGPQQPALFDALGPVYCQRLAGGSTLVSIRGLSRVVEIDRGGQVVWELAPGLVRSQYSAVRLPGGSTLVADAGNHRVVEFAPDQRVIWERGGLGYPAKAYRL